MAEQRLPIVYSDHDTWGYLINQYITKEHYDTGIDNPSNGSHKTITIRPGTTSAGTAPLKFISGDLLRVPEAGTIEFDGSDFYITL